MKKVKLSKSKILSLIGILLFFYILIFQPMAKIPLMPQRAIALFILCFFLWVSNIIPLSITSLLAIVLLPILNLTDANTGFSFFGSSAVFFLLGVFILSSAVITTGLSKRLTLAFLSKFGKTPKSLIFGILFTSCFLALLMPAYAVTAMMFPIVLEIARVLKLKKHSSFAFVLFISLAWGSIIGSVGTFLGGARAPLALGLLEESFNMQISFIYWFSAAAPVVLFMSIIAYLLLTVFHKFDIDNIDSAKKYLEHQLKFIGKIKKNEIKILILVSITIFLWVFFGNKIGLAVISVCSACTVFILNIAQWQKIEEYINWGVIIMYGGAIALGKILNQTHAFKLFLDNYLYIQYMPLELIIVFLIAFTIFITEGISNTAAVAILLPIGFGLVNSFNLSPVFIVLLITIPAGLPFCMPMGSPPNAICFSSGYYSLKKSISAGIFMNIFAIIVFVLTIKFFWPLIGLNLY